MSIVSDKYYLIEVIYTPKKKKNAEFSILGFIFKANKKHTFLVNSRIRSTFMSANATPGVFVKVKQEYLGNSERVNLTGIVELKNYNKETIKKLLGTWRPKPSSKTTAQISSEKEIDIIEEESNKNITNEDNGEDDSTAKDIKEDLETISNENNIMEEEISLAKLSVKELKQKYADKIKNLKKSKTKAELITKILDYLKGIGEE